VFLNFSLPDWFKVGSISDAFFLLCLMQPLSNYHKKYIENLDIEADAQLLRDELNIGQEAIDYFRASSALLKAGVKAGLTLYDIAILCCRSDNLAEVPSMMEKLFSMASELAHAAVENERWHHGAASRALVEQLTPHRRLSMVDSSSGYRIRKSVSSGRFSIGSSTTEPLEGPPFIVDDGRASPGMAHSSVSSESSSDSGDNVDCENVDCEEWAANVIADVSVDPVFTGRVNRRSLSIASDDGSCDSGSVSHKGFWSVRPGAYPPAAPSDDGSITWSPQTSPRTSLHVSVQLPDLDLPAPIDLTPKTPTVTFSNFLPSTGPFIPPSTVDIASTKSSGFSSLLKSESLLPRSKSFSSLPRGLARGSSKHDSASAELKTPKPFTDAYDNYRKYFHKFIDLVIVRETTAALRQQAWRVSASVHA
jgi:hypothetical protein